MYQIIEKPVRMTYVEMKERFDGKWLYLINCELNPYKKLISGIPVIISDHAYEGVPDGIYEPYKAAQYAPRGDVTFVPGPMIIGLSAPIIEGMTFIGKRNSAAEIVKN